MQLRTVHAGGNRWWLQWRFRLVAYALFLVVVAAALYNLRGTIPQALGRTPIRVRALSLEMIRAGATEVSKSETWAVTAQIIGMANPACTIAQRQFLVRTTTGASLRPYGSSLPFDSSGRLTVAKAETLTGVFLFSVPREEKPSELWWKP